MEAQESIDNRNQLDKELQQFMVDSKICMEQNRKEIEKMSSALFGEDGIVSWARDHIEAERERKELFKELKQRLIVRGTLGAIGILVALIWYGFTTWIKSGGPQ